MSQSNQSETGWLKLGAFVLFVGLIAIAEYLFWDYQRYQRYQSERNANELAVRVKSQLETELHGATFLTHGIEAYVVARNGNIVADEINSMLGQVYQFSPYFRNIGIAPDNELRWVMPREGNEAAVGVRYEELPSQWPSIKKVIAAGEAKLVGPLQLVQGALGLIYRSPVFIDGTYWGIISAVIDAESLFQSIQADMAAEGRIGLRAVNPQQQHSPPFLGDQSVFNNSSTLVEVDIPGGKWQLAIDDNFTTANVWPARLGAWFLSFLGALGFFYVSRHFYQRRLLDTLSTEVQARTKEVVKTNDKLNAVLRAASETAIIATDKNGTINLFNRGAERMLGYQADEVVNKQSPIIFHDATEIEQRAEELAQQFGRPIAGFSIFTAVPDIEGSEKTSWTYVTKSGHRIPIELTITKEFDSHGKATGYLGLATDISRQLNDQTAMRELKERLESATKVANVGVWELDILNRKMLWNRQMFALTGLSTEKFDDHYASLNRILHPEDRQLFDSFLETITEKARIRQPFRDEPPSLQTTFRIIREDNDELRWQKGHAMIKCDRNGVPVSMLGTMLDISELVFARQSAEQAEQLKSQFLSTVSHELRTPLSVISGALSLLSLDSADFSDETKHVLQLASRNSERLTLLINDLLDIEKMAAGQLSLNMKNVSAAELVQKAIAENKGYAKKYDVNIQLDNQLTSEAVVTVDELRFMQVMANLLSNAAKFSPPKKTIRVEMSDLNDRLEVRVVDKGEGIPESFKERIFQPFAQAQSSNSQGKGGTGLGLAITKTIIEQMGGSIGFKSEPGQDTVFWLRLPKAENDQDKAASKGSNKQLESTQGSTNRGTKNRILHVEDYADFSQVIAAILKDKYQIDRARSVSEAAKKLAQNSYDLIVLDIILPDGSGWEVVKKARSLDDKIKIVVTSNHEVSSDRAATVDAVLNKARFTRSKFTKLIDSLAGR